METKVEGFDFRAVACGIAKALICESVLIIYCVVIFLILCAVAIINGNNTFFLGITLAAIVLFAVDAGLVALSEKSSMFANLFGVGHKESDFRQYMWLMTLPIAILLISSCTVFLRPTTFWSSGISHSVAIIENVKTGEIVGVTKMGFFNPGKQRVKWVFLERDFNMSKTFKTRDGKTVQWEMLLDLSFTKDDEHIESIYREYNGSWPSLQKSIEREVVSAFERTFARYDLSSLPSSAAIIDEALLEANLKKFYIKSGSIAAIELPRTFGVKTFR